MKILTIIMSVAVMWLMSANEQGAGAWTFWLSLGIALSFIGCQHLAGILSNAGFSKCEGVRRATPQSDLFREGMEPLPYDEWGSLNIGLPGEIEPMSIPFGKKENTTVKVEALCRSNAEQEGRVLT